MLFYLAKPRTVSAMEWFNAWCAEAAKILYTVAPPLGGGLVGIIVGKDYSPSRVVGGMFTGLFMAWCFTDITVHYLHAMFTIEATIYPKVYAATGAMFGITGWALASRLIDIAATFTPPVPFIKRDGRDS